MHPSHAIRAFSLVLSRLITTENSLHSICRLSFILSRLFAHECETDAAHFKHDKQSEREKEKERIRIKDVPRSTSMKKRDQVDRKGGY